ncbi:hypothetical protein F2P81_024993 [Scophthalmus maximus]|uniref:Uncharacterized protein n=1 Tax=Scophthalmus maximus TaxID=52904 RepID=A0A6A4RVB9_SCOMX|nr:hypothetical protein F2P81_024993 [Scophthalmus maximus]
MATCCSPLDATTEQCLRKHTYLRRNTSRALITVCREENSADVYHCMIHKLPPCHQDSHNTYEILQRSGRLFRYVGVNEVRPQPPLMVDPRRSHTFWDEDFEGRDAGDAASVRLLNPRSSPWHLFACL